MQAYHSPGFCQATKEDHQNLQTLPLSALSWTFLQGSVSLQTLLSSRGSHFGSLWTATWLCVNLAYLFGVARAACDNQVLCDPFSLQSRFRAALREPAFKYNLCHTNCHPLITFFFDTVLNSGVLRSDALFHPVSAAMNVSPRQDT